jgi:hypothetical protein
MAVQGFQFTPVSSQIDSTALTNSTTATTILPPAARFTLPNNFFYIGKMTRFTALGRISTVVTTPGTLTFSLRFGAGPVIVATSDALALNIVAKTNVAWMLQWVTTARAIGGSTSANLMHDGLFTSEAVIGSPLASVGGQGTLALVNSAPAVGTGFDSTAAQVVDLFATWSVANAANSITTHQFFFEDLN